MNAKKIQNRVLLEKTLEVKALHANFYRQNVYGDCSNKGISSKYQDCILAIEIEGFPAFTANGTPILYLRNNVGDHVAAYPPDSCYVNGDKWYMAGGNFVYTSDSRLTSGPLSVHDRLE